MTAVAVGQWVDVCDLDDLVVDRGVAALVAGRQVALFRLDGDEVCAVDNHDPCSGANVIARGLVGTRGDAAVVSSPMYKQAFDLRTGRCLDEGSVALAVHPVRIVGGRVQVGVRASGGQVSGVHGDGAVGSRA